jgi:hypothetical protein
MKSIHIIHRTQTPPIYHLLHSNHANHPLAARILHRRSRDDGKHLGSITTASSRVDTSRPASNKTSDVALADRRKHDARLTGSEGDELGAVGLALARRAAATRKDGDGVAGGAARVEGDAAVGLLNLARQHTSHARTRREKRRQEGRGKKEGKENSQDC